MVEKTSPQTKKARERAKLKACLREPTAAEAAITAALHEVGWHFKPFKGWYRDDTFVLSTFYVPAPRGLVIELDDREIAADAWLAETRRFRVVRLDSVDVVNSPAVIHAAIFTAVAGPRGAVRDFRSPKGETHARNG